MRFASFALALLIAVSARGSERAEIDRLVRDTLAQFPEVPGLSVAVVRDGKTLLAAGYGFADRAAKRPMTATTPVYLASSTKGYTALMIEELAQRHTLDLDAPIVKYLPELDAWPDAHRVTLRELLTHSARIRNDAITMRTAFVGDLTPAEAIRLLPSSKSVDRAFDYGNFGYVAAGFIAERVSGRPWQQLLRELVLKPLTLHDTTAYVSQAKQIAVGYDDGSPTPIVKSDATMHPAGGLVSTADDLAKWLRANLAERDAAMRAVHAQQVALEKPADFYRFRRTGYALGWYAGDFDGTTMLHDMGSFPGWRSHVSLLPKEKIGVAVIANASGVAEGVTDVVAALIYDRLLGRPPQPRAAEMRTKIDHIRQLIAADAEKRSKRLPSLTKPLGEYAGRYENPAFGTFVVAREGDALVAHYGPLHARIEPFTQPESGRVELIPGQGEIVRFRIGEAASLEWSGEVFVRTTYPSADGGSPVSHDAPQHRPRPR